MSTKAKHGTGAGKRKNEAAAPQPKQQQQHSDTEDNAAASASSGAKANRRAAKKAKHDAATASAAAAAAEQARKAARPALTQKRAARRERTAVARHASKEEEERELENFLFGNEEMLLKPMAADDDADAAAPARKPVKREGADDEDAPEDDGEIAFEIDTTGAAIKEEEGEEQESHRGRGRKGAAAAAASAAASSASDAAAAPQAAWNDADDASHSAAVVDLSSAPRLRKLKTAADERFISGSEYSRRLRAVFTELNPGTAAWATLKPDASDADITSLLLQSATAGSAVGGGSGRAPGGASRGESLPSTTLDLLRLKDANVADPSASIISSVRFHPNAQLLLTAGMDKMIRLFQIDGVTNTKVQGVWLEDLPIHSAEWLPTPSSGAPHSAAEIIATGRRSHFYSIDVESSKVTRIGSIRGRDEKSYESMLVSPSGNFIAVLGNDGYTLLLDAKTKMLVASLKQNGSVRDASFSSDGSLLLTTGDEGSVYGWDMASRKCLFKHADHGSIANSALAVAPTPVGAPRDQGYYACGAESGVVNLYNRSQLSDRLSSSSSNGAGSAAARMLASASRAAPTPLKSIMNLVTPIDLLRFNHDASLLLLASRRKKDACKLVHVSSGTVFANWPTSSTPLHYLTAVDFSPNSGLMALGNDRGRVLLYRLTHYPRA